MGIPFWAALLWPALVAGVVGIIFGLPSLRIKGFYLIMATVAAYFIIHWLVLQFRGLTGGTDGLVGAAGPTCSSARSTRPRTQYFYLVMVLTVLATLVAKNILRTRSGRAFVAIRDNDLAAEVMGVNLFSYKLQAFFIGCVFAGVAGALSVQFYAFANIEQFPFFDSVWLLGMLIVGGMGSTSGRHLRGHRHQAAAAVRHQDRAVAGRDRQPAGRGRAGSHPARPGHHPVLDLRSSRHRPHLGAVQELLPALAVLTGDRAIRAHAVWSKGGTSIRERRGIANGMYYATE